MALWWLPMIMDYAQTVYAVISMCFVYTFSRKLKMIFDGFHRIMKALHRDQTVHVI